MIKHIKSELIDAVNTMPEFSVFLTSFTPNTFLMFLNSTLWTVEISVLEAESKTSFKIMSVNKKTHDINIDRGSITGTITDIVDIINSLPQ